MASRAGFADRPVPCHGSEPIRRSKDSSAKSTSVLQDDKDDGHHVGDVGQSPASKPKPRCIQLLVFLTVDLFSHLVTVGHHIFRSSARPFIFAKLRVLKCRVFIISHPSIRRFDTRQTCPLIDSHTEPTRDQIASLYFSHRAQSERGKTEFLSLDNFVFYCTFKYRVGNKRKEYRHS